MVISLVVIVTIVMVVAVVRIVSVVVSVVTITRPISSKRRAIVSLASDNKKKNGKYLE